MNNLREKYQRVECCALYLKNLPPNVDEQAVSDHLYSRIGLDVPPDHISVTERNGMCACVIVVSRSVAAQFLEMCLKSVGEHIIVEPAQTTGKR